MTDLWSKGKYVNLITDFQNKGKISVLDGLIAKRLELALFLRSAAKKKGSLLAAKQEGTHSKPVPT